jgi:sporulation protein YlmC with PRC-barrel domain
MDTKVRDLVGLEAFARDGGKIGKVKDVICDADSSTECIVIKYGLFRDLVVPSDVVQQQGDAVTVPFSQAFLDVAPRVATKGQLSSTETERLERFFHPSA